MTNEEQRAQAAFEHDNEIESARESKVYDNTWVGLRLYLHQDDGLWLFSYKSRHHPVALMVNLDQPKIEWLDGITGLVRAAYHSERVLKTFKMAKLPYDLISLLKENLADIFDSKMVVEILNENNLNYDPTYRSLVLFFSVDADKMKVYTHKQVQLKWFSRSDIMTANEQDGRIIGIDDLHLKVLSDLIKK